MIERITERGGEEGAGERERGVLKSHNSEQAIVARALSSTGFGFCAYVSLQLMF